MGPNPALLFAMALAGSLHCAGMCGPLALLATAGAARQRSLSVAVYLAGKTSTYVFLGALAGALGETIVRASPMGFGGRALSVAGGALLVIVALHSAGLLRDSLVGLGWLTRVAGVFRALATEGYRGKLLLGGANGLLPCPLTYAFLALAASTGSTIWGAATMLVLGITTAVPLGVVALAGHRIGSLHRLRAPLVSGVLIAAVGILMLYRGLSSGGCG